MEFDTELSAEDLQEVVNIFKQEYLKHAGKTPQDQRSTFSFKAVFEVGIMIVL